MVIEVPNYNVILIQYWNHLKLGKDTKEISNQIISKLDSDTKLSLLFKSLSIICGDWVFTVPDFSLLEKVFKELGLDKNLCCPKTFWNVIKELVECDNNGISRLDKYKKIFNIIKNDNSRFRYICISLMIDRIVVMGLYSDNDFVLELTEAYTSIVDKINFDVPDWFVRLFN